MGEYRRTLRVHRNACPVPIRAKPRDNTPVRGTGLEPAHLTVPEPKGGETSAKALDLLESESPGSARNGQGETEFRRTATVGGDDVETPIRRALEALARGDHVLVRRALLEALVALESGTV